jgi:hypothetical protein
MSEYCLPFSAEKHAFLAHTTQGAKGLDIDFTFR